MLLPKSTPSLVLAKSKGCTKTVVAAPASPPLKILAIKNWIFYFCVSLLVLKKVLKYSLNEKPRAWVGKYLTTLTQLPLHRASTPSSLRHRRKQSVAPLYGRTTLEFSSWVCMSNFTRSIGATTVLEMMPATPPDMKSFRKSTCFSDIILLPNTNRELW